MKTSEEFKGIKGEWKVGKHPSTVVSTAKVTNTNFPSPPNSTKPKDDEIERYGGYLVAVSIGDKADAHLIAAAPDLLEALLSLMDGIGNLPPLVAIDGVLKTEWEHGLKAINKALGK